MTGMDAFLSGLQGSGYVAIANQYLRRPVRTTFAGHVLDPSPSPNHAPTTDEIVDKVCRVLADARQAPNASALYLVFTDGFPSREASAPGTTGDCAPAGAASTWPTCRTWPTRPSAIRETSFAAMA